MSIHYQGSPNNAMHLSRHLKAAKIFASLCGQVMASGWANIYRLRKRLTPTPVPCDKEVYHPCKSLLDYD
jgi:hypothetical protein